MPQNEHAFAGKYVLPLKVLFSIAENKFSIEKFVFKIAWFFLAHSSHKWLSVFFPLIMCVTCTLASFLPHSLQSIYTPPIG